MHVCCEVAVMWFSPLITIALDAPEVEKLEPDSQNKVWSSIRTLVPWVTLQKQQRGSSGRSWKIRRLLKCASS